MNTIIVKIICKKCKREREVNVDPENDHQYLETVDDIIYRKGFKECGLYETVCDKCGGEIKLIEIKSQ